MANRFDPDSYISVSERIEKFYAKFASGRIVTSVVEHDRESGFVLIRAEVYREPDDALPAATGHAYELKSAGHVQAGSYVEVCECVPTDTEILTRAGWQKFDTLQVGQDVLAYDINSDTSVWTPLERVTVYDNARLIRMFNGKGFDVLCTPFHSWATYYKGDAKHDYWKLKGASDLTKADRIITACPAPHGDNLDVSVEMAALMGWVICDGHFSRPSENQLRIGLGQSKPKTVAVIKKLMANFSHGCRVSRPYSRTFPSGRTYECLPSHQWQLHAAEVRRLYSAFAISHESELPQVISQLTGPCRAAMLEAMMLADGHKNGRFGKKVRPWVMDVFTLLCALEGKAVLKRTYSTTGEVPIQMMKKTRFVYASHLQKEEAGQGYVWCPTTAFGTWYARFSNGVTTITGNTSAVGRALALLGFEVKRGVASREEVQRGAQKPQAGTLTAQIMEKLDILAKETAWLNSKVRAKYGLAEQASWTQLSDAHKGEVLTWLAQMVEKQVERAKA